MATPERFTIIIPYRPQDRLKEFNIQSVPWSFIADHEKQAEKNHSQSLLKLNSRGGLTPLELYTVKNDLNFKDTVHLTEHFAMKWLMELKQKGEI